ncbi:metallophosphoesterase [Candidatus Desantisbacteria bacterium CG_4_10_14_0_8_um_filter_48_22]|uniref:Metallophosphoesterase n=1 Tax=Candidatus Desantisbacteria bacterium CG_4_10_14_0_8_um_filter_48_22 TaxID=1974543 RepID=A0A2M7SB66_9BACT|nr:MAG: hypothetical protein AUJ67_06365 [Candidatus Desantisbacteria bacterium CG1_02_49_89]PIV55403.1 MAG: metallophosphoesterase [Candidatus Desantisbacteria bacterium CG02_land_8_20_14_3_00_49_13]PIZ16710.1 MAG: metallophosphoesterase [Candidatus Desantisbacteria bacterium CG_4_10_14_0_8_um_filter_48_22]PJB27881.1 MAG: metallophosphoesterase [Candidatus Desantisbacteria bacterium CG_4_9_14_3_um_filter_50_7]
MKYGIISDIHGNLEALNACLEFLEGTVKAYICAGDIVGYGPRPNECVEAVSKISELDGTVVISGNHDLAAVDLKDVSFFKEDAKKAILWTAKVLTGENRDFISKLKTRIDAPHFTVAHGSPREPEDEYLIDGYAMKENLAFFKTKVCFVGHSHIPLFYDRGLVILADGGKVKVVARNKAIASLGSVGQPRDRNPSACAGVYDDRTGEILVKRFPYNIRKTQEDMAAAGLPRSLIERLALGI